MTMKLGELLIKANVLQDAQLKAALAEQSKWGGKLGEILVRMNFLSEDILVKALAKQLGLQRADLDNLPPIPDAVLRKLPVDVASDMNCLPVQLRDDGKTLVVAMAEPNNIAAVDALRARTGCRIVTLVAGSTQLARARARVYQGGEEEFSGGDDEGFKLTDAQGKTLVKKLSDIQPPVPPPAAVARPTPVPQPVPVARMQVPPPVAGPSPQDLLASVEAVQRKEVAALKAMVEILIEKGVFTRDEYLARVKR